MAKPLSPTQRQALIALRRRATLAGAAQFAGVHVRTVRRWMSVSPLFRDSVRNAQLLAWREEAAGGRRAV